MYLGQYLSLVYVSILLDRSYAKKIAIFYVDQTYQILENAINEEQPFRFDVVLPLISTVHQ